MREGELKSEWGDYSGIAARIQLWKVCDCVNGLGYVHVTVCWLFTLHLKYFGDPILTSQLLALNDVPAKLKVTYNNFNTCLDSI